MSYQKNLTAKDLSQQLLVGLKRHLLIAQSTNEPKQKRLESLANLAEVVTYVIENLHEAIPPNEQAIYSKFFVLLLVKLRHATIAINGTPDTFVDEIGFISTLLKI